MREFVLQYLLGLRKDLSKFNNNLIIDNKDEILIELRIKRLLIAGNSQLNILNFNTTRIASYNAIECYLVKNKHISTKQIVTNFANVSIKQIISPIDDVFIIKIHAFISWHYRKICLNR